MIQHEIDHLDGVLILDRVSARGAQAGDAGDARGAERRQRRLAAPGSHAVGTVFLGTSEFAAAVLERLARQDGIRPALVLTRPDRPAGRGRRLQAPPVAERARELGIALEQPENVNEDAARELISPPAAGGP